jgi:hypothetical protein
MPIPWKLFIAILFCECIIDVISGKETNSVWFIGFLKLIGGES